MEGAGRIGFGQEARNDALKKIDGMDIPLIKRLITEHGRTYNTKQEID